MNPIKIKIALNIKPAEKIKILLYLLRLGLSKLTCTDPELI